MKNFIKLIGIIAMVAIIGFGFTACDNNGGESSGEADPALNGIWVGSNDQAYIFKNGSFTGYATNAGDVTGTYSTSEGVLTLKNSQGKESGTYSFIDDDTLIIGTVTYRRPTIDPDLVGTWKHNTYDRIYTFNNDGSGYFNGSFVYTTYNGRMERYSISYYWCNYKIEGDTLEMRQYSDPDTYTKQ